MIPEGGTPRRLVSPTGAVHEPSGRVIRGELVTFCGMRAGEGWSQRIQVPVRPIGCQRCIRSIRKAERPRTRRRGEAVAIDWTDGGTVAVVSGGRDENVFTITTPADGVCLAPGCGARLSRFNRGDRCALHEGAA